MPSNRLEEGGATDNETYHPDRNRGFIAVPFHVRPSADRQGKPHYNNGERASVPEGCSESICCSGLR